MNGSVLALLADGPRLVDPTGPVQELRRADEVLLLSSVRGVTPVTRLDGRALGTGPVTRELAAAFEQAVLDG